MRQGKYRTGEASKHRRLHTHGQFKLFKLISFSTSSIEYAPCPALCQASLTLSVQRNLHLHPPYSLTQAHSPALCCFPSHRVPRIGASHTTLQSGGRGRINRSERPGRPCRGRGTIRARRSGGCRRHRRSGSGYGGERWGGR